MKRIATPRARKPLDDAEQLRDLVRGERGGRLVHDQDADVQRERLGDLDGLLLREGQPTRGLRDVHPHVEAGEHLLGFAPHPPPVDDAPAIAVPDEDVLGDTEVGEDHRLLIDRRDRVGLGVEGAAQVAPLAVDEDLTDIGLLDAGHDLDERRLAGPVLAEQRVISPGSARARRRRAPGWTRTPSRCRASRGWVARTDRHRRGLAQARRPRRARARAGRPPPPRVLTSPGSIADADGPPEAFLGMRPGFRDIRQPV